MLTPKERLQKAIGRAAGDMPFFSTLLVHLRKVETTALQTLGTDGESLFFNPEFCANTPIEDLKKAALHEAEHVAHCHPARMGQREPMRWNVAADYVVNGELAKSGVHLPDGWLYDANYHGMSVEQVYALLPRGKPAHAQGLGSGCGCVQPHPARDPDRAEHEMRKTVARAVAACRDAGIGDAMCDRFADSVLGERVKWYDATRAWMRATTKRQPSWRTVNRRWLHRDIVLPGRSVPAMGPLAVVIDTSGSIGQLTYNHFWKHITDIAAELRPERLIVLDCDTQVHNPREYEPDEMPAAGAIRGGGGTCFQPPFDWLSEHGIEPDGLIYLTDLENSDEVSEPDYPVLWVSINPRLEGPFGETLQIRIEE